MARGPVRRLGLMDTTETIQPGASPDGVGSPVAASGEAGTPVVSESSSGVGGAGAATPGRKRSKARRRKPSRRRVSRVAPAEPEARALAAEKAIRERAEEAADEIDGTEALPDSATGAPADAETDAAGPSPEEIQAFADASEPVIRVGLKGLALALRGRFPSAADRIAQAAPVYASRLAGTVGLRLAGLLGAKVGIAAIVAEFAEAFIDDRLAVRPGEG